jgi:hypothetical protein
LFSNRAAAAGENPCVPAAPSAGYYAVGPMVSPIVVPRGGQATVDLLAFANGPLEMDKDEGIHVSTWHPPGLGVSLGQKRVAPGEHVELDIQVPASAPAGSLLGVDVFGRVPGARDHSEWPLEVLVAP